MLREISPLFHADKIKRPLIVLQGANDPRVIKPESDDIVAAVKKNGVPVEYVVFPDEGHGFSKRKNQIEGYGRIREFLDKHLKGAPRGGRRVRPMRRFASAVAAARLRGLWRREGRVVQPGDDIRRRTAGLRGHRRPGMRPVRAQVPRLPRPRAGGQPGMMRQSFDQTRELWSLTAEKPDRRAGLAAACAQQEQASQAAMSRYDCDGTT